MTMRFSLQLLEEPELEFGGGSDTRVKEGLTAHGPYSIKLGARHPGSVHLGLVGPADDLKLAEAFINQMSSFIPTLGDRAVQRPAFPGFASTFASNLQFDPSWRFEVADDRVDAVLKRDPRVAFGETLDLFVRGLEELGQRDPPPDVIVVAIPNHVTEHCGSVRFGDRSANLQPSLFDNPMSIESATDPRGLLERDFRRALKAAAMRVAIPIQIVTPNLYSPKGRFDDPASRAWNLSVALFYKAGGAPWRLANPEVETLYVGISFHHRYHREGHSVFAGLAQAFYPGSEGFALRGGEAEKDPEDLRIRLGKGEMRHLIERVLEHYRVRTARTPRRVVVHKTTAFDNEEIAGARSALDNVPQSDFVALRSSPFRLLRQGDYPPARGSFARLGDRGFLLTTGYQRVRETYKGSHIPVPLDLITNSDLLASANVIMRLTKLNWNSAADHTLFPVTLAFAQKVGTIMAEVPDDQEPQTRFSYYI